MHGHSWIFGARYFSAVKSVSIHTHDVHRVWLYLLLLFTYLKPASYWRLGGSLLHAVSAKSADMQCCRRCVSRPICTAEAAVTAAKFTSPILVSVCIHSSSNINVGTHRCCYWQQRAATAGRRNWDWKDSSSPVLSRAHV